MTGNGEVSSINKRYYELINCLIHFSRQSYNLFRLNRPGHAHLLHTSTSRRGLEEFFDLPENWGETTVKSGATQSPSHLQHCSRSYFLLICSYLAYFYSVLHISLLCLCFCLFFYSLLLPVMFRESILEQFKHFIVWQLIILNYTPWCMFVCLNSYRFSMDSQTA